MLWHFPIFGLAVEKSRSTQVDHLNNFGRPRLLNATYQVPRGISPYVLKKRFLKICTIYGLDGLFDHVTKFVCIKFHFVSPVSFNMTFGSK